MRADMREMLANLVAAAASMKTPADSPWLARREPKRIDLVFITSDKGLAGAFNSNLIKASQRFFEEHAGAEITLDAGGSQGPRFLSPPRSKDSSANTSMFCNRPTYRGRRRNRARNRSAAIATAKPTPFTCSNNEFKSVMAQKLSVMQLLPVELDEPAATSSERPAQSTISTSNRRSTCWIG